MDHYRITDCEMFEEDFGDDIEGLTRCIIDHIRFCEVNTVPARNFRRFPNNKQWINREIKLLLGLGTMEMPKKKPRES